MIKERKNEIVKTVKIFLIIKMKTAEKNEKLYLTLLLAPLIMT